MHRVKPIVPPTIPMTAMVSINRGMWGTLSREYQE
jgi:hypothetical protein